jgi:hypothetical protein
MKAKLVAGIPIVLLCAALTAHAATLRVVHVETSDLAGYTKAIEQGQQLLKSKGSPVVLRVWKGRFAGSEAGAVVVTAEFPNLEALAKDDAKMKSDPELKSWLDGLNKMRKIVSDSIYEEQ